MVTLRARWARLRKRRWLRWTIQLAVLLLVVVAVSGWQTRGHLSGAAPAFSLPTLSGETVSLQSFQGKPVLLAFWAPWCGVCKLESRNFSWVKRLAGERAYVVSVASGWEQMSQVQQYAGEQQIDYPVLLDVDQLSTRFKVEAFPTVYFLDAQGRVKRSAVGYTTTVGLLLRLLVP